MLASWISGCSAGVLAVLAQAEAPESQALSAGAPAPVLAAAQSQPAPPAVQPAPSEAPRVELGLLRERPLSWLGQRVRVLVQLRGRVESWEPLFSRFTPARYCAIGAWADEQLLWRREEHEHPFERLFVRRGGAAEAVLALGERYQRYELTAVVREALLGEPWLEIESAVPEFGQLGEGGLLHASRARELEERGQWALAAENYGRALAGLVPEHARLELERLREACRQRAREPQPAASSSNRR